MTIESELGRALESTPANKLTDTVRGLLGTDVDEIYEEVYDESLEQEPDALLFHGSPAESGDEVDYEEEFEKIEERYEVMLEDAENISEKYGGKDIVIFEDEHTVLDENNKLEALEELDMEITVEDSDQEMAYDDWASVPDGAENVRSYTSSGNREKLQALGKEATESEVTVFGTPSFSATESVRHYVLNRFIDTPLQRHEKGRQQLRDPDSLLNRARAYVSEFF